MNARALLVGLALLLVGCGTVPAPPIVVAALPATAAGGPATITASGMLLVPYTDPPAFTGQWRTPGGCQARGPLPDPLCTPGSVGSTDQAEVCAAGPPSFSERHRPPTDDDFKTAAMTAYGIPAEERGTTEADHLVPPSLAGSNDVTNVWAQRSDIPGAGWRNTKDRVEMRVWTAVCQPGSTIRLVDAQAAFAADWTTATAVLGL